MQPWTSSSDDRTRGTQNPNPISAMTVVTGIAGILFGVIVGYIIGTGQSTGQGPAGAPAAVAASAPASTAPQATAVATESELQTYRDILARDPKNAKAAETLGNKLYDAGRYAESVPYYQQALANAPGNVHVSTDLGTAMYYSGRPDDALAQLDKSLAMDATHAQTLFNIGIVKRDGKKDPKGAVAAWERLLATSPGYPEAERVRALIAESK
jgi:cytochrome c-type biogenesis protein CcmH/NrfG